MMLPANIQTFIDYTAYIARGEFLPKEQLINWITEILGFDKDTKLDKQTVQTRLLLFILALISVISILVVILVIACKRYNNRVKDVI